MSRASRVIRNCILLLLSFVILYTGIVWLAFYFGGACTSYKNDLFLSPSGRAAFRIMVNSCEREGGFDFKILLERGRMSDILYDSRIHDISPLEADRLISEVGVKWISDNELSVHVSSTLVSEPFSREFDGVRVVVGPE